MQTQKAYKYIIVMGAILIVLSNAQYFAEQQSSAPHLRTFSTVVFAIGILMVAFGLLAPRFQKTENVERIYTK